MNLMHILAVKCESQLKSENEGEISPMIQKLGPDTFKPLPELPDKVRAAAFELIAHAINTRSDVLNITIGDASHDGQPLGSFEISVRRL